MLESKYRTKQDRVYILITESDTRNIYNMKQFEIT